MRNALVLASLGSVMSLAGVAMADVSFRYVSELGDGGVYSTVPGQTVNVKVYLKEILSGTSTSLLLPEQGISDAGAILTRHVGETAFISLATPNTAFADLATIGTVGLDGADAELKLRSPFVSGGTGILPDANGVYLGSFDIVAGAEDTTFDLGSSGQGTLTFLNIINLDDVPAMAGLPSDAYIPATGSSFIVAVPEPALLGLLGVGAMGLLARQRRHA